MAENLESRISEDLGLNSLYDEEEVEMVDPPQNQDAERSEITHKCYSGYPWEETIQEDGVTIQHCQMDEYAIEETTELILCDLRSQEPKLISVACYHVYLSSHPVSDIMEQLSIITAAAQKAPAHKLVLSSTIFLPEQQQLWGEQTKLNFEIRRLCFLMERPNIPLHKVSLFVQAETKTCAVKKACFTEAVGGVGLGRTLTPDTLAKAKQWVIKYHKSGFEEGAPMGWKMTAWDMKPTSLQYTPGYRNPAMIQRLKDQGTFREPRNNRGRGKAGASRRGGVAYSRKRELGIKPAGVQEARTRPFGRGGGASGSSGYSSSRSLGYRKSSCASSHRTFSSDSVFEGGSRGRGQSQVDLMVELEELRRARRMELEDDRRQERERQRADKLEAALEKARDEVGRLNTQVADLKKELCSLRLDNERINFNNQEAWGIIRSEWRRRDEEQARREREEKIRKR